MERENFLTLLTNFSALNEVEGSELIKLSDEFPYSQVIHNLCARAAQDCNLPGKEKLLQISAIYSTDRSALKSVMTAARTRRVEPESVVPEVFVPLVVEDGGGDQLREQVRIDLASLQESKRLFEVTIARLEQDKATPLVEKKQDSVSGKPAEADSLIDEIKSTKKK